MAVSAVAAAALGAASEQAVAAALGQAAAQVRAAEAEARGAKQALAVERHLCAIATARATEAEALLLRESHLAASSARVQWLACAQRLQSIEDARIGLNQSKMRAAA